MFVLLLCPRDIRRDEFTSGKFMGVLRDVLNWCIFMSQPFAHHCPPYRMSKKVPQARWWTAWSMVLGCHASPWGAALTSRVRSRPHPLHTNRSGRVEHQQVWQGSPHIAVHNVLSEPHSPSTRWRSSLEVLPPPPCRPASWVAHYSPKGLWHLHLL